MPSADFRDDTRNRYGSWTAVDNAVAGRRRGVWAGTAGSGLIATVREDAD